MKNLILKSILGLGLLTGAAQANSFLEYSLAQSSAQESQIFGIQPVSEIVGSDSIVHKFKYGTSTERARIFFLESIKFASSSSIDVLCVSRRLVWLNRCESN